jgi:hypothetical protein
MINPQGEMIDHFFAGYRYHGNAGAFINLVFPSIAGLAIMVFGKGGSNIQRAVWLPCLGVCPAGAVAAASKAGMVVTTLLVLIFASREALVSFKRQSAQALILGGFALAVVSLGIVGIGYATAAEKWTNSDQIAESWAWRWLAHGVCTRMLGDAGAWGIRTGQFHDHISVLHWVSGRSHSWHLDICP